MQIRDRSVVDDGCRISFLRVRTNWMLCKALVSRVSYSRILASCPSICLVMFVCMCLRGEIAKLCEEGSSHRWAQNESILINGRRKQGLGDVPPPRLPLLAPRQPCQYAFSWLVGTNKRSSLAAFIMSQILPCLFQCGGRLKIRTPSPFPCPPPPTVAYAPILTGPCHAKQTPQMFFNHSEPGKNVSKGLSPAHPLFYQRHRPALPRSLSYLLVPPPCTHHASCLIDQPFLHSWLHRQLQTLDASARHQH
jgi:hypothetical protein